MVLQSGMNALNPVRTHPQPLRRHLPGARPRRPRRLGRRVPPNSSSKVELPAAVLDRYPGELSGGMRQRVSIALALSLEPKLMVFDEPTTALDVLVQHAVMDTIIELQKKENFTALLISHDLGIVLESAQRVLVMHEGEIVEDAPSRQILEKPGRRLHEDAAVALRRPARRGRGAAGLRRPPTRSPAAAHPPTVSSRTRRQDQKAIVVDRCLEGLPGAPPRRVAGHALSTTSRSRSSRASRSRSSAHPAAASRRSRS